VAVTNGTLAEGGATLGIGELAHLTGVPVRTIRFYCDEGLLSAHRSAGGHRRFARSAVEQLRLVRRLRGVGLGLPAIACVLAGERSLGEAVAAERAALDAELAALAWRRASLRAVEEADPVERAARLELLAAVEHGPAARDMLVAFWRGVIVAPVPEWLLTAFIDLSVPEPPDDPEPAQVVAYAELVTLAGDRSLTRELRGRAVEMADVLPDERNLMADVGEACTMVAPALIAGEPARPGPALDRFVDAHAEARGGRDTPGFRRRLLADLMAQHDPRIDRYWSLVGEVTGEAATLGAIHSWLVGALARCTDQNPAR
jgi:excisionase family DNA binding protein